jgi:pimeloyl-ACP methyl ester carboxylesterase
MIGLEAWFAAGQRVPIVLPDKQSLHLFYQVTGVGPWVTFLHGFPTCSWDWAEVTGGLAANHQLLIPDLLGFGDSDKPAGHDYSLVEQADLVEALWRHFGIDRSALIAHDIGGSVAQELLARQSEGRLAARLTNVVFLNAALYHGVSRCVATAAGAKTTSQSATRTRSGQSGDGAPLHAQSGSGLFSRSSAEA